MNERPGADAKPLEGDDLTAYNKSMEIIQQFAQSVRDGKPDTSELSDLPQVDPKKMLGALFIPKDAGDHAAGLEAILRRIPDGWGRWIRCDKGWYPIIVALDEKIAAIAPEYEVYQVKEKFGTLRYYCSCEGEAAVYTLITEAERQSSTTCEACGTPGQM